MSRADAVLWDVLVSTGYGPLLFFEVCVDLDSTKECRVKKGRKHIQERLSIFGPMFRTREAVFRRTKL